MDHSDCFQEMAFELVSYSKAGGELMLQHSAGNYTWSHAAFICAATQNIYDQFCDFKLTIIMKKNEAWLTCM